MKYTTFSCFGNSLSLSPFLFLLRSALHLSRSFSLQFIDTLFFAVLRFIKWQRYWAQWAPIEQWITTTSHQKNWLRTTWDANMPWICNINGIPRVFLMIFLIFNAMRTPEKKFQLIFSVSPLSTFSHFFSKCSPFFYFSDFFWQFNFLATVFVCFYHFCQLRQYSNIFAIFFLLSLLFKSMRMYDEG